MRHLYLIKMGYSSVFACTVDTVKHVKQLDTNKPRFYTESSGAETLS